MDQNTPSWKKIIYPILALLAVPVTSIITLFTIPIIAGGSSAGSARNIFADILMFIFATFAIYYLIVFLSKIAKPQNKWMFANRVFWGYVIVSIVTSWLYYSNFTSLILSTPHLLSFNVIANILKGNVSKIDFTYILNTFLWIISPFVIYYLLRRKFKFINNTN